MKLTFFLIALFLVLLRVYFSWAGHGIRGDNEGNMTISSDNYIEQIKWSGKIRLSEDETTVADISPGGYLKFRENDKKLSAKSNLQGQISYELYNGNESLNLDDSGRRFIAVVLQKMIAFGFDAEGRPERIYKRGGKKALLDAIPHITLDNAKGPYLNLLFKTDSLSKDDLTGMIKQIDGLGTDVEKENYLNRFTTDQLRDSVMALPWLEAVKHISQDIQKSKLLTHFTDQGLVSEGIFDRILNITDHFGTDIDKEKVLTRLINKGAVPASHFDKLLQVIRHFGSDVEKENLYTKLMNESIKSEEQWICLINETAQVSQDFEKSNLLVQIAQKMPKSENTKAAYLKVAKSITNDTDYGKAIRAVE
jgi:hypothetical protein